MSETNPSSGQIVTHDPEIGASYIYLAGRIPPGGAVRQVQAGYDIILDFDADGHLVGIELLESSLLHPALFAGAIAPGDLDDKFPDRSLVAG